MTNEDGTPIPKSTHEWRDGHKPTKKKSDEQKNGEEKKADEAGNLQDSGPETKQRAEDDLERKASNGIAVVLEASESQMSGVDDDLEPVDNNVEYDFEHHTPPSSPPVIERTAMKAHFDSAENPWQPHTIPWRDPLRQRDQLNTSQSRIKTDFLLTAEFIDDVNFMLDFISGWPQGMAEGIMRSFSKDPENQNRKIDFVGLDDARWGVRLINPATRSSGSSYELPGSYTRKDLPKICQKQGCDEGCPRRASFEELATDLEKFRKEQMKAKQFKRPPLPRRTDQRASPLLPALPRSNERTVPKRSDDVSDSLHAASAVACPSSPRPGYMALPGTLTPPKAGLFPDNDEALLESPPSPRPGSKALPPDMTTPSPALPDDIRSQVERVKIFTMMHGGPSVLGRDAVKYLLEKAHTEEHIPLKAHDSLSPEAVDGKMKYGPLGGKLVHNEKIPAGSNSIRAEELRQNFPLDNAVRKRSRAEFFAARVPSEPKTDSGPARLKGKQSIAPNSTVTKVKFRPQYEKHPEAY